MLFSHNLHSCFPSPTTYLLCDHPSLVNDWFSLFHFLLCSLLLFFCYFVLVCVFSSILFLSYVVLCSYLSLLIYHTTNSEQWLSSLTMSSQDQVYFRLVDCQLCTASDIYLLKCAFVCVRVCYGHQHYLSYCHGKVFACNLPRSYDLSSITFWSILLIKKYWCLFPWRHRLVLCVAWWVVAVYLKHWSLFLVIVLLPQVTCISKKNHFTLIEKDS